MSQHDHLMSVDDRGPSFNSSRFRIRRLNGARVQLRPRYSVRLRLGGVWRPRSIGQAQPSYTRLARGSARCLVGSRIPRPPARDTPFRSKASATRYWWSRLLAAVNGRGPSRRPRRAVRTATSPVIFSSGPRSTCFSASSSRTRRSICPRRASSASSPSFRTSGLSSRCRDYLRRSAPGHPVLRARCAARSADPC